MKKQNTTYDGTGKFIKTVRTEEKITLRELSNGLCASSYLAQIENGEREAYTLLTDALLQRLGKSTDFFCKIIGHKEYEQWILRGKILRLLSNSDFALMNQLLNQYKTINKSSLHQQFCKIVQINQHYMENVSSNILYDEVIDAIKCTIPDFNNILLETMYFSRSEGYLLLAWLKLREDKEGLLSIGEEYLKLYKNLTRPHYDKHERIHIISSLAFNLIDWFKLKQNHLKALTICEETLQELSDTHLLTNYVELLMRKIELQQKVNIHDIQSQKMLFHLQNLYQSFHIPHKNFIPYEENKRIFCFNHLIRSRRCLYNLTQQDLATDIITPRTVLRIENCQSMPQKQARMLLLQKLGVSAERYNFQIITDSNEEFNLCIDYLNAWYNKDFDKISEISSKLESQLDYIKKNTLYMQSKGKEVQMENIQSNLSLSLPLDFNDMENIPPCILSINETLLLFMLARKYAFSNCLFESLLVVNYLEKCISLSVSSEVGYYPYTLSIKLLKSNLLEDLNRYDEAYSSCIEGIKYLLETDNMFELSDFLFCLSHIESKRTKDRTFLKSLLQQAYTIATLSLDSPCQKQIAAFYKDCFNQELAL